MTRAIASASSVTSICVSSSSIDCEKPPTSLPPVTFEGCGVKMNSIAPPNEASGRPSGGISGRPHPAPGGDQPLDGQQDEVEGKRHQDHDRPGDDDEGLPQPCYRAPGMSGIGAS